MLPSKIGGLHDNAWLIDNVSRVGRWELYQSSARSEFGVYHGAIKKKNWTRSGWLAALLTRFRRPVNKQPLVVEARDSSPVHRPWHAWLQVEWRYGWPSQTIGQVCVFAWLPQFKLTAIMMSELKIDFVAGTWTVALRLSSFYKSILRFNPTLRVRYRRSGSFKNSSHCWYLQSLLTTIVSHVHQQWRLDIRIQPQPANISRLYAL